MTDIIISNTSINNEKSLPLIDEELIRSIYIKQAEDKINKLKQEIGLIKPKRTDAQKRAYLKYYNKNHEKMLEYKKKANKIYYEKHRKKCHCEKCDIYYAILGRVEAHFLSKKHQNAVSNLLNKFVIKNTVTDEYIM